MDGPRLTPPVKGFRTGGHLELIGPPLVRLRLRALCNWLVRCGTSGRRTVRQHDPELGTSFSFPSFNYSASLTFDVGQYASQREPINSPECHCAFARAESRSLPMSGPA